MHSKNLEKMVNKELNKIHAVLNGSTLENEALGVESNGRGNGHTNHKFI